MQQLITRALMCVQAAVQQAAPATLIRAWPRLFAKQAGPGEQQGGAAAADGGANGEASSSSGDEAEAAGAAADLDVAELQELLGKAQEEVRCVGSVAQRGPPVVCEGHCVRVAALVCPRTLQSPCKQTRLAVPTGEAADCKVRRFVVLWCVCRQPASRTACNAVMLRCKT